MKIASWNVNSLNVRLQHVLDWLEAHQPDVLGLQETKLIDDKFPVDALLEAGYHSVYTGQKTYNGVALLSREPGEAIVTDIPQLPPDSDRRVIAGTFDDTRVINLYVVNGKAVGSEKYAYKLEWLDAVTQYIDDQLNEHGRVVVIGDFNIAPDDRDVHDPAKWEEKILCSTPERDALARLFEMDLADSFRLHHDDGGIFSWWDYRMGGYQRGLGLRIDLILTSPEMSETCLASYVDVEPRKLERPSDHAPVVAEFA